MAAWKTLFDAELLKRKLSPPFSAEDYQDYVDGKPRDDGTKSFLASRHIRVTPAQIVAMGNKKNALFLKELRKNGVHVYPGSLRYVKAVRKAGLRTAVVSSSTNCKAVVAAAGLAKFLEVRVDGRTAKTEHLRGKPQPDTFAAAAKKLGTKRSASAVFEDALAGVEAGRRGKFGAVIGVDRLSNGRGKHARGLKAHGADRVVTDLGQLIK